MVREMLPQKKANKTMKEMRTRVQLSIYSTISSEYESITYKRSPVCHDQESHFRGKVSVYGGVECVPPEEEDSITPVERCFAINRLIKNAMRNNTNDINKKDAN